MKTLVSSVLVRLASRQLKQIEAHIKITNDECKVLIEADKVLSARHAILTSIPGISNITATTLLSEMPELGSMDKRQAASLAGLAPITRQSGTWKGKSFIRGGRANLRRALYMPALVAIRYNEELKSKYAKFIANGKAFKVAITAIMRKLITTANALLRDNRKWTNIVA